MPKSFLKIAFFSMFGIYILYGCVLVPAYEFIICDYVLASTLWLDAVDILLQWMEFVGMACLLSFLIVGVHHAERPGAYKPLLIISGAALIFKYLSSVIALSLLHGSFFDFTLDFGGYVLSLAIEISVALLVTLLTWYCTKNDNALRRKKLQAAKTLNSVSYEEPAPLLPFLKIFDRRNPLLRSAMVGMGTFTAVRTLSYIISEISYIMLGFAPKLSDIPIILLYFVLMVLLPGFLSYLFLYFFTNKAQRIYIKKSDNTQSKSDLTSPQ